MIPGPAGGRRAGVRGASGAPAFSRSPGGHSPVLGVTVSEAFGEGVTGDLELRDLREAGTGLALGAAGLTRRGGSPRSAHHSLLLLPHSLLHQKPLEHTRSLPRRGLHLSAAGKPSFWLRNSSSFAPASAPQAGLAMQLGPPPSREIWTGGHPRHLGRPRIRPPVGASGMVWKTNFQASEIAAA